MSLLNRILLTKIFPVMIFVSIAAGVGGYWHAKSAAEENSILSLSMEAKRALSSEIIALPEKQRQIALEDALHSMVGGMFSKATIYSSQHEVIVDAIEPGFEHLRGSIERASHPDISSKAKNDIIEIHNQQVLRIFIPLDVKDARSAWHLEGVRFLSKTEEDRIQHAALISALIAVLSVLTCAAVLVPLLSSIINHNFSLIGTLRKSQLEVLEVVGRAIARRDSDTGLHNYRVTWMAAKLGEELGLSVEQMRGLIAGAFLHDIGKIGIPDNILLKPGLLTETERKIIQSHVDIGIDITRDADFFQHAREVIAGHHEKWDGSGYPSGLQGDSIPLNARIFSIVDVYDALRAKRPYKNSFSLDESLDIMRNGRGSHFDPVLLDLFFDLAAEIEQTIIAITEKNPKRLMREIAGKYI